MNSRGRAPASGGDWFADRLPLSRVVVDRDHAARADPGLLERPAVRFIVLHDGGALLAPGGGLAFLDRAALPAGALLVYLGTALESEGPLAAGTPLAAAIVSASDAPYSAGLGGGWGRLRHLIAELGGRDAALFGQALAIANWHASHGFSPRTGEPTTPDLAGWLRRGADGHPVFPRTDPAVIVGVTDAEDRLLLGRNASWPEHRYSLLAGFVEPGESLEAAVAREVREEAGIRVVAPRYLGSQPWPFPASLMLGFRARLDPDGPAEAVADGEELLDVRWFSRDEIAAGAISPPGSGSIARAIVEDWFGGELPDGSSASPGAGPGGAG
ncbi:MAG: NAD(+) diphosphatase [Microbacteriaceae bacterium]